jgi:hypothetical protein
MKRILEAHGFVGNNNTYYKKIAKGLWLEFNIEDKILYITDISQSIKIHKNCSNATELNKTLIWILKKEVNSHELICLIFGLFVGIVIAMIMT